MLRRPMGRRRGLGLVGTAAVGAAAYHAGSKGQQTQTREQEQEMRLQELEAQQAASAYAPAPAPPPPPPAPVAAAPAMSSEDRIAQLKQLAELHSAGVLTDEEFAREKARILG